MDGELFRRLYHRLLDDPKLSCTRDCTFCDAIILLIYFFGVFNDKSPHWACDKEHWPIWCRHLSFPGYSQLMKRLKCPTLLEHMQAIDAELRARIPTSDERIVDGKPLVVGGYTKDPDAKLGKVPDGWAKGYKLHAIVDAHGIIHAFDLTDLACGEATVARRLVQSTPMKGTVLRGDSNYDSNALYDDVAKEGGRLIAPRRKPGTGLGHHRQHPDRLRAIAELEQTADGMKNHKRHRNRVEQSFAHLGNLPFGLWGLPNFVRRLPRVKLWVTAKILLYHLHKALTLTRAEAA